MSSVLKMDLHHVQIVIQNKNYGICSEVAINTYHVAKTGADQNEGSDLISDEDMLLEKREESVHIGPIEGL